MVKILGHNLGYRALCSRFNKIWSSTSEFDIIDLANDYLLIRFSNAKDVGYALTEGPWTVLGHYLSVQKWTPKFDVVNNTIDRIVAWIHLSEMNIHFYYKNIIPNTVVAQRGKFAHLAVELDLQKPLVSQFNLEGRIQKVEYENLPMICFGCGKFGHYKDACLDGVDIDPMAKDNPIPLTEAEKQDIVVAGEEPKFGSWMVVARKPRPRKVTEKDNPNNPEKHRHIPRIMQSCFDVLEALVNKETISQNHETDSASQPEIIVPILESTQNLAPKSRSMKKKPAIQQFKKYPSRKANILNLSTQSMTENIDPNTQILNNYSHPHKQPSVMHGMYDIPQLSSMPILYSTSNVASTSMHGMYAYQRSTPNQPRPIPVPITINVLHHSVVSFPKAILAPQANDHLPSQNVCDPSLDGEPPNKVSPRDSSTKETNVELRDSPIASMTGELSSANSSLVVTKSGMEVEAEALESSQ